MDSGARGEKTLEESMKNLKIDAPSKASESAASGPRESNQSDAASCISSGDAATGSIKGSEVDQESFVGDQGMYYYGYCYPGFNSPCGEWDDKSYYMPNENFEMQPSAVQADDGSLYYYFPQSGYSAYNPVIPGAVVSIDGQYMGQSYYPSAMFQQPLASPGFVPSVAYGPEMVPAYAWDSSFFSGNGFQLNYGDPTTPASKSSFYSRSKMFPSSKTSTSSKSSSSEIKALDVKPSAAVPKQSIKLANKGSPTMSSRGYVPMNKIPSYANQAKGGVSYPNSPINVKESGRNWTGPEKVMPTTKHMLGDFDHDEQNRGPRTNGNKNSLDSGINRVEFAEARENDKHCTLITTIRRDMYNLADFKTKYDHALFFVIKSYSEDDIHKSIKYNVWASTPNGNRRLDNAFNHAQQKAAEKGTKCPVFLFFSVNASGQFCGVAEMLDHVDFNKNMNFWQQDKWNGFFPVKWHIIKDVPNPQFWHILLENNENKPVTNSRDTQEVKFPQGIEMLNIFKNYSSKTSILDDFDFYESRQKSMQHKRSKLPTPNLNLSSPKLEEFVHVRKPDELKSIPCLHPEEAEANGGPLAEGAAA